MLKITFSLLCICKDYCPVAWKHAFLASASVGAFLFYGGINMNVTTEMYTKLFNELTNVKEELEMLIERIKQIQIETEDIYINSEN